MITREMTWAEIEEEFGPLVEIPLAPNRVWDRQAIAAARDANLLWTRVDPGLVSTGYHFVNRECYFRAARPYAPDLNVYEVDDDIGECARCGDFVWCSVDSMCDDCRGDAP